MARILLVDDEKVARALYGDYLLGAGHQVSAVGSVQEAKDSLAHDGFEVVVTDLILPEGNGLEVLAHAKARHPATEVIVITSLDKVDPAVRAMKGGAADFLVKPVSPEVLAQAVSRALTTRRLLAGNEALRGHVELLETSRRLAAPLERQPLLAIAAASLAAATRAEAVVLYGSELQAEEVLGMSDEQRQSVLPLLEPQLRELTNRPLAEIAEGGELRLDEGFAPFATALALPAIEGELLMGTVVLLFKDEIPASSQAAGLYLAGHLALALRNLGGTGKAEDLAYLDELTHLFNDRYLHLMLDRELEQTARGKTPFSLLFLDLDYFKSVNDTHGQPVGSKLLVEVARIVKGCVRDKDVACRFGADEYVVLLRGTDSGGALKVGERIRRSIETHHFLAREGYGLSVTTCIGVASFPEHADDKATLLDLADRAVYRGKRGSRNVIYVAAKGFEAPPAHRRSARAA